MHAAFCHADSLSGARLHVPCASLVMHPYLGQEAARPPGTQARGRAGLVGAADCFLSAETARRWLCCALARKVGIAFAMDVPNIGRTPEVCHASVLECSTRIMSKGQRTPPYSLPCRTSSLHSSSRPQSPSSDHKHIISHPLNSTSSLTKFCRGGGLSHLKNHYPGCCLCA